ncbi:hypothetical protein [Streptomyces sp. NPDC058086]|uniref:hypothetical protein n=1 Tax=Streptomyces sp. NPDC058086 TaxID=3346334 RepID=UPI0036E5C21D
MGGDWYDVIKLPGERTVLVVSDMEGHAMESAAVMGQLRGADPGSGAQALLSSGSREAGADLEQLADYLITDVSSPQQRRDDALLLPARYEGAVGEGAPRTSNLQIQRRNLRGVKAATQLRGRSDERLGAGGDVGRSSAHRLRGRDQRAHPRGQ